MKDRIIKISLAFITIILAIVGFYNLAKYEVSHTSAQAVNYKASDTKYIGELAKNEINPDTYTYNINTKEWEARPENFHYNIPKDGDYQTYCIKPGTPNEEKR